MIKTPTPTIARRTLLGTAAATMLSTGRLARAQSPVTLNMTVWGAAAEEAAFNAAIAKYKTLHPDVTIRMEVNGNAMQAYQQVDTRLAGRQAPDIFRVQYQQVGRYASARAVVDLTQYVDVKDEADFAPAFWQAASYKGKPYAMPHHTDTFALYYNRDMFEKIGVVPPTSLDKSWTWVEFLDIARKLKAAGAPYGFAMSWQNAAFRWLPFLYQHGGQLLSTDLAQSNITSKQAVETIAWTQSWFREGLVPPSTSVKSSEQPQNLFANGTVGMLMAGDWQIPFLSKNMTKYNWGVTYMPRDVAMASDLGGNCFAVSRDSKRPDIAADFVKFLSNPENMHDFVSAAQFLPVRKSLMGVKLPYALRPDAMEVFVAQSATIPSHLVSTVTLPNFSKMNAALTDQLDLAFTSGQDATATAQAIDQQVRAVLAV